MKKIIVSIILILMSILPTGCASESQQEPPELTITIGDQQIDYAVAKNDVFDRKDAFKTILKNASESKIPYIEAGSTAVISFTGNPPSDLTVLDILLDENGNQMYTYREVINIPVELKDGKGSFEIKKHWASALSSFHVKNKTDIRGFKLIANWGENECEYAFIIRTDSY